MNEDNQKTGVRLTRELAGRVSNVNLERKGERQEEKEGRNTVYLGRKNVKGKHTTLAA